MPVVNPAGFGIGSLGRAAEECTLGYTSAWDAFWHATNKELKCLLGFGPALYPIPTPPGALHVSPVGHAPPSAYVIGATPAQGPSSEEIQAAQIAAYEEYIRQQQAAMESYQLPSDVVPTAEGGEPVCGFWCKLGIAAGAGTIVAVGIGALVLYVVLKRK
jgi:hypothetical protein